MKIAFRSFYLSALSLLYHNSSVAHHVMDGNTAVTITEGFISGLGHPIIEIDHFAFVCAVGLLCALCRKSYQLPFFFIIGTILGVSAYLYFPDTQVPEITLAASLILFSAMMFGIKSISVHVVVPALLACGTLHGFAYGEGILGAEQGPIISYLVGLFAIQLGIASLLVWIFHVAKVAENNPAATYFLAGIFGLLGIGLATQNVAGIIL